ncbi:uncharacterized protein LOC110881355 [Helianthus annuus]|uniref:uncharacterized protein LOC110881355 n=1 Tax=Helianthus annuus TaxID=4232 RepID=UPI000B8FB1EA|nr:uncharacterized protein LOC110881355 [Helianthus annuus]
MLTGEQRLVFEEIMVAVIGKNGGIFFFTDGGRTAHSRFHIPLNLTEDSISGLESKCKLLRLTKNMRLTVGRSTSTEKINSFAKWLLDLGEGNVGGPNDGETTIEIPQDLLITDASDPIASLIDFVYPSILENVNNHNYFSERAILAPKNDVVHEINDRLLSMFPSEET